MAFCLEGFFVEEGQNVQQNAGQSRERTIEIL